MKYKVDYVEGKVYKWNEEQESFVFYANIENLDPKEMREIEENAE